MQFSIAEHTAAPRVPKTVFKIDEMGTILRRVASRAASEVHTLGHAPASQGAGLQNSLEARSETAAIHIIVTSKALR